MLKKIFYLVAVTVMLSSVAHTDDYQDADEPAKVDWSGSPFFTLFPSDCGAPTKQCVKKIDSYSQNHWGAWASMNAHQEMSVWIDCISKVEDMKRHRAMLEFAKDNTHKWHYTTPQIWALAMGTNFRHCSVKK